MDFVKSNGVERKAADDFVVEQVAENWKALPESVAGYEPAGYGGIVDDLGNHLRNQRLPGGYHLTVDLEGGPVNLHFDAYDPLNGPIANYKHWYYEMRRINSGGLKVYDPVNDYPDWGE
jgi:hypothetical protein